MSERSSIKGLYAFDLADAQLFARLQRETSIQDCLHAITDRSFRFGVLSGDSGCGKTSLLQAGLWPRLVEQGHRCVYIRFSDSDPLTAVRRAVAEQLPRPDGTHDGAQTAAAIQSAAQADPKPLVLLCDQFEQFFVHARRKKDREPLLNLLSELYRSDHATPIKILICIRSDFSDRLVELQRVMGYALGPRQHMRIEKFEPDQATEIFRVIAEEEGLPFDRDFVAEFTGDELAGRADGLVSPVDIQVLAWMIAGQRTDADRAFNRGAYRRLGGVEGLLERFLTRALAARETEARRQTAIKVMVALADLDRNTRAGALALDDLAEKLAGTATKSEIEDVVLWLARGDVRLISPTSDESRSGYELAHERLIPALRRVAGKTLSEADRANQILERRVNEWLGNDRGSRWLLPWWERRRIERQIPYITWGPQQRHKQDLLRLSKRRTRRRAAWAAVPVVAASVFVLWWFSDAGQVYLTKRDVVSLSGKTGMAGVLSEAGQALALSGELRQARTIADRIDHPSTRASTLAFIALVSGRNGNKEQAATMLEQASGISDTFAAFSIARAWHELGETGRAAAVLDKTQREAESIPDSIGQATAFLMTAGTAGWIGDRGRAEQYWKRVRDRLSQGTIDDLHVVGQGVVTAADIAVLTRDPGFLGHALRLADEKAPGGLRDIAHVSVARATAELGARLHDRKLLEEAVTIAGGITYPPEAKAVVLSRIAEAWAKIGDGQRASDLIRQARQAADRIGDSKQRAPFRAMALSAVAAATSRNGDSAQASGLLARAFEAAGQTTDQYLIRERYRAMRAVAEAAATCGRIRMARRAASRCTSDEDKLSVYAAALKAWAVRGSPRLAEVVGW
jgi:tetratricopeptide (TPR) repeat protein